MRTFLRCRGIQLFRLSRWRAELWVMPPGTRIPDHIHRHLTVWIAIVWGKVVCRRAGQRKLINGPSLRFHRIEAGTSHGALTGARGGAFLAIERWKDQKLSATEDFELSPEPPSIRLG